MRGTTRRRALRDHGVQGDMRPGAGRHCVCPLLAVSSAVLSFVSGGIMSGHGVPIGSTLLAIGCGAVAGALLLLVVVHVAGGDHG